MGDLWTSALTTRSCRSPRGSTCGFCSTWTAVLLGGTSNSLSHIQMTFVGRLEWVARYLEFQAGQGDPVLVCPAMYREPLDLYKLYNAVREEGGFNNCTVKKAWKNISPQMTPNFRQPVMSTEVHSPYYIYSTNHRCYGGCCRSSTGVTC